MRLYKTFNTLAEAKEFAKKMDEQERLAFIQQKGNSILTYEVVYFMSKEDRNGDLGGEYGEKVEL